MSDLFDKLKERSLAEKKEKQPKMKCFGTCTEDLPDYGGECQDCKDIEACKEATPIPEQPKTFSELKMDGDMFKNLTNTIPEVVEQPKTPQPKITKQEPEEKFKIQILNKQQDIGSIETQRPLTFEEKKVKIEQTIALLKYTAENALNADDFWTPPRSRGKKALTRSGCNKLATIFNITVETLNVEVKRELNLKGEEDIVAYATVRATRPGGSSVTVTAYKALSDYASDKPGAKDPKEWVDIQTLKGTAETRGHNRAIQNAIGFVPKGFIVATKEEFKGSTDSQWG